MTLNILATLPDTVPASGTSCKQWNPAMDDWNEIVRDAMKRRGMTNSQLARELDVNQTTVGRWLNGHSTPGASTIRHIGSILGIKLAEATSTGNGIAEETELLAAFRRMTAAERTLLLRCLRDREHRCHHGPNDTGG
jgi:transcriptional regulator with XRE-family HTH domain